MKRHFLSLTKPELRSLLLACEGELFYHELHEEKALARCYTSLCGVLQRKLDGIAAEERFRARERRRTANQNVVKVVAHIPIDDLPTMTVDWGLKR